MKFKKVILFLFLLIPFFSVWAQKSTSSKTDDFFFSLQYSKGITAAHRPSLSYLIKDYPVLFNFEIGRSMNGKKSWHQIFNYPYLGLGYAHFTLGNNEIFGLANAWYGFIDVPYYPEKKLNLDYKIGLGISYISNCFNVKNNIFNFAIGSHLNVYFNLAFDLKYNLLNKRLILATGFGITHVSNGKIQSPNLGLNILDFHLSTRYFFGKRREKIQSKYTYLKKHSFMIIGAGGAKEYSKPNMGKFFAGNLTFEYEYRNSNKVSWGIGSDIFYDGVLEDEFKWKNDNNPFLHANRAGLHLTYGFHYHKVDFIIQMGSYLFPYSTDDGYFYHRVGFRVLLSKHLIANLTMKTHWARADIVEFGIGYYWEK